jgi:hypothetical protein
MTVAEQGYAFDGGLESYDEDEVISFSDNMKLKRWEKFLDHPSELPD